MEQQTIPLDAGRAARIERARENFPGHVVDRVVAGIFRTDGEIDAVVADFATMGRGAGWRVLGEALRTRDPEVTGAPESLTKLLTPLLNPPDWFDPEQVRRGAQLWWRFAPAVIIGLGGTLLTAYSYGDLNKPQAMNSRSETMAARRYEETSRWVLAATEPGALTPGGTGFDATIRIRFVHAMVRRHLRECGAWNPLWGEPIHTTGMAMTADGFLLLPLAMHELFDMSLGEEETEAVRQLWHWIGYLMGVPEELLAHSIADATDVSRAGDMILAPPDEDTEILTRALLKGGLRAERVLPQPLWALTAPILRPAVSRVVWGGSAGIVRTYLDIDGEPPRNHPVVFALRQLAVTREWLRRKDRLGTDESIARRQRRVLEGALDAMKAVGTPVHPGEVVTPR